MRYLITFGISLLLLSSFRSKCLDFSSTPSNGEIVFIFNQPKYFPGDTVYFGASLHGFASHLTKGKRVVGLSLIDANNEVRHYSRTLFIDGLGRGQMVLSSDLQSGGYWLVANIEGFILEGDNSMLAFKTRFLVSGEFDDAYLVDHDIDSIDVNLQYSTQAFKNRKSIQVSFKPDVEKHTDGVAVSVFKESLFLSKNKMLAPSAHQLVPITGADWKIDKKLNPYLFKGLATLGSTQIKVPDSTQIVFYLNNSDFIYQVFTDGHGEFSFPLFKDFADEEIFYIAYFKGEQVDSVQLELNFFEYKGERISASPTKDPDAYAQYRKQLKLIDDSYHYFTKNSDKIIVQNTEWWPDVDYEVDLGRLEPFNTMVEVFQSVIPLVKYKKSEEGDGIRVFLKKEKEYSVKNPIFIIDGIMTDNLNYFFSVDPRVVKQIGVCRTPEILARYGRLGENGIVVIETVNGQLPVEARTNKSIFVTGISKPLAFQESQIEGDSRIPLFKSCLYWNPRLKPNDSGMYEFLLRTSDDIGNFIIQITWIDEQGKIYSKTERILITP